MQLPCDADYLLPALFEKRKDTVVNEFAAKRIQTLVAIMKDEADWRRVQEQLWYRVPVASAPRRWPPQWLAFYQTKIFKDEAYSIRGTAGYA